MNTSEKLLNPDYRDMVECLLREGVDFMLVGGYAVAPKDIADALTLEKLREKKNG